MLITSFWLSASFNLLAQEEPPLPQIIPPSPNAAELGKYASIPVSTYTGVPQISIPLHEVNEREVNLPISLSYHASGIKVNEYSTYVGMNWSLQAGGVITQSVQGLKDDFGKSPLLLKELVPDPSSSQTTYFVHRLLGRTKRK